MEQERSRSLKSVTPLISAPNGGPGGLEGHVSNWKTWIFSGPTGCTHKGAFRRSGQGGPAVCILGRAVGLHINMGLPFSAALRLALLCNLLDTKNSFFFNWKRSPPAHQQCWTWSGFRIAIQPDSAIQKRIRIGLDSEKNSSGSDMDIQTALITAVKCLMRAFFGYKPDWIKYLNSTTGLVLDWITQLKFWTGLGLQKYPIRSTQPARGGRNHFFRLRLRSCFKTFESGSGSGNFSILRIRLLFRLRLQSTIQP